MSDVKTEVSTEAGKTAVAKSFRDFKTVTKANDPANTKSLKVVIPGIGDTGHEMYVRSMYCTEYRDAQLRAQRQLLALATGAGGETNDDMKNDIITRSMVSLVAGWTFEEAPTPENIFEFLIENPTVYEDLNVFAAKDSNFF